MSSTMPLLNEPIVKTPSTQPTRAEATEPAPMAGQQRILLWFCATVFIGVLLCVAYLARRTPRVAPGAAPATLASAPRSGRTTRDRTATANPAWLLVSLPDPPKPLPASASPYLAEVDAADRHAPLKLDLLATQDTWLEVETDGRVAYAKLLHAEQRLSFEASSRIRLVSGNATGLKLRFNGEPVAAAGAEQRTRSLEFTSTGARDLNAALPATTS